MPAFFASRTRKTLCARLALGLRKPIGAWVVGWAMPLVLGPGVWAQDVRFNTAFFPEGSESVDLSVFQQADAVVPGEFRVDVFVNDRPAGRHSIVFSPQAGGKVGACFAHALLQEFGIDLSRLSDGGRVLHGTAASCLILPAIVTDSQVLFDPQTLALRLSIRQVAMRRKVADYVDSHLWDFGATAMTLGYTFNSTRYLQGTGEDSAYFGGDAGLNLGPWRARHNGSLGWQPVGGFAYQGVNSYVQRDLAGLSSQLTLGETYTTGDVFDTLVYRGVQLATDDRMLPQSLRGYAPVKRAKKNRPAMHHAWCCVRGVRVGYRRLPAGGGRGCRF